MSKKTKTTEVLGLTITTIYEGDKGIVFTAEKKAALAWALERLLGADQVAIDYAKTFVTKE